MRKALVRCVLLTAVTLPAVASAAWTVEEAAGFQATVKSGAERAGDLPAPARLRLQVSGKDLPVASFTLVLPPGLAIDPRGIRRCTKTVEELVAADRAPCRRSRVGSGTLTRIAADGTRTEMFMRVLRGPGDSLSFWATDGVRTSAASSPIDDGGHRLELESLLTPEEGFGGMTLRLGHARGRSAVRLRGCDGGELVVGFTTYYPAVSFPGGGGLTSETLRDFVPCALR